MTDALTLFTGPDDVAQAMRGGNVQVVAVDHDDDFARAHVPGALLVRKADITTTSGDVGGLLPTSRQLAAQLASAGLRRDRHIVAYDQSGGDKAARLLYTLDVLGHHSFSLLDGGLAAWRTSGHALADGPPPTTPGDFAAQPINESLVADRHWLKAHLDDDAMQILDVRSRAEFTGEEIRSARGGHVPGATHLDWQQLKDDNDQLRCPEALRQLLTDRGIDPTREIVTYCHSHMRSSYAYLVLKALGFKRVRGYPGAWSDWGNASDTQVER